MSLGWMTASMCLQEGTSLTTLEVRVTKLEREMKEVQNQGSAARLLASGAHEDTGTIGAKLNAQTSVLEKLRETQVEQGKEITSLRTEVATLTNDVHQLDTKVEGLETEMRAGFTEMRAGFTKLTEMINVENKTA